MDSGEAKVFLTRNLLEKKRTDYPILAFSFIATIIFHIAIFCLVPRSFADLAKPQNSEQIEIEFEELKKEEFRLPEYAEANPNANSIKPENPAFDSFQDQKASQETDADEKSKSPLPEIDGEEASSKKIVQGDMTARDLQKSPFDTLNRPLENLSNSQTQGVSSNQNIADGSQNNANSNALQNAKNAQSDSSQKSEYEKDSSPIKIANDGEIKVKTSENLSDEEVEKNESIDKNNDEQAFSNSVKNLPKPQSRPKLSMQNPYGLLAKNNYKANAIGAVAIDSKFSEFGAYQQRMFEAICRQWYLLAATANISSEINTSTLVEFYLNSNGEITSLKVLKNTATQTGKNLCTQAILSTAPYGVWTKEMLQAFNSNEQPVKIHFHYR